ncbi:restriction endonuclease subunit S [uncultured Helicobacter sp.]|uniref:restriction endonuclease subunit S n=1 Tax=uncultured Helicobacter sp. TaxID=175537 RepID=UPI002582A0DB|nr:restriction endonuclease subunit S [uncultured Helicobacter sp.]
MQNLNESLQAKYPHLELAILPLSQVQMDNESKRIDSEFAKKIHLKVKNQLLFLNSLYLKDIVVFNARYTQPEYNQNSNLKIINSQYLRNEFIDYENAKTGYGKIVPKNAVLVNSTGIGTLGRVNINLLNLDFSIDSHINVLILNKESEIKPCYLMVFLQSKYGQFQIERYYSGSSGQIEIYPKDFNNFLIPKFPQDFQLEIEKLVKQSHEALEDSKRLYKEAQELLYKELELDFKNPLKSLLKSSLQAKKPSELAIINDISKKYPHLNISVRPLSKSLHKSGRLDSEYYQSKYDLMETKIKDYKGGYCKLQNLVLNYSGGFAFSSDDYLENGDLALIRINNIKNADLDMSNAVYLKKQCEKLSSKDKVKQGDILISMSGSIGLSCLIKENIEAMTNQRILKISIKDFSGDVLVLLLNSIFCRLQFERIGTGGVQTNISSNDILNILIPKINPATQEQIALKIQKSFTLRAKSKDLLESAKVKVEQNIQTPANQA